MHGFLFVCINIFVIFVIILIVMDMLILNKERISRLCGYYSHRFTDEELKKSVKVRYEAGAFVVLLVCVDLYFENPNEKKRHIYFGDLNSCFGDLQDLLKEIVAKVSKTPYKITLMPCIDHFDIDINFLFRKVKEKEKIEISFRK